MHPPLPRSLVLPASLAGLVLLLVVPARAADSTPAGARPGLSVTVRPGESWEALRGRMFPLQALKRANPGLDPDLLHPGQVVRAPYVPASELDRERAAREGAGRQLAEARGRLATLERDSAAFESQRRVFARAGDAMGALRNLVLGLIAFAVVLLAALGMALQVARAAKRRAEGEASRRREIAARHESLRRSLSELETGLQRRMMGLLHMHGAKIITEKELDDSVRPVIDLAGELRKKHGSL